MAGCEADLPDVEGDPPVKEFKHGRSLAIAAVLALMALLYWLSGISDLTFFRGVKLPSAVEWLIETFRFSWGTGGYFSYGFSIHPDNLLHKAGHITLYGVLGICLYVATGRSVRWAMLIVTGFAFSDEWHQSMVPGRDGRFFDVILDTVSAGVAVWWTRRGLPLWRKGFDREKKKG